ncbi:Octanoyltransferase [Gemmatirosa kalamazoonensis]|uniref:Octanoyltransferase n=1 Tax=Gemmatirosa kalamazoonensis TaxID=861299 RepID=W0RLA8_9BACT|nr:lipoyl(octanoyl) transferase LipB [Gemmatirosa kalamazoonensis]AHG90198.1 Octanoyltransferase [Gemmatirosa kalamazoonensis]
MPEATPSTLSAPRATLAPADAEASVERGAESVERKLLVVDLGRMGYGEALELQRAAARARIAGSLDEDVLLLVEHPAVVTLGRSTKATSLPLSADAIRARGVEVHEVERGGDVTFHGPGQLVGYPIVDLKRHKKDLHWYLRQVEQALIDALATFGIAGGRVEKYTGVWVGSRDSGLRTRDSSSATESRVPSAESRTPARKIASIGVHARDWVTWHGFALNVTTSLSYFDLIVPCGIHGVEMTSVARELGRDVSLAEVGEAASRAFASLFALEPEPMGVDALAASLGTAAAR